VVVEPQLLEGRSLNDSRGAFAAALAQMARMNKGEFSHPSLS